MPPVRCNFASALYDRMVPLAVGEVQPAGLSVNFIDVHHPRDIFDRMIANQEFDASELSSSEYITRHVAGDSTFIALPVFPSRVFRHSFIIVNKDRIKEPKDLNGKRIGVQLYTMTAAVFIRGLLQHEYGVDISSIEWVEGKMEGPGSHGKPSALKPLKPIKITQNTNPTKSLSDLLESGEIDATIGADIPACLGKAPHIDRLFPDFKKVEMDYYKRTGIFPIMHLVAMRRDYYEQNKFAASALYNALNESKELARKRMESTGALRYMLPWLPQELDEIHDVFGEDCWPYGIEENRKTLEALVQYLYDQSMIEKKVPIEELFAPVRKINFRIG
ncbi:4,5-dihydroxyphthalate decarboxylase [Fonsecaea pedrosoi]|nr:4,5-dihydroxyphthalate decarboxylase [Fonsecaea pedrosoi]